MSNNRNNNTEQFSEMFKALSNPHRLKIFVRLINCCKPGVACEVDSDAMKACVGQVGRFLITLKNCTALGLSVWKDAAKIWIAGLSRRQFKV